MKNDNSPSLLYFSETTLSVYNRKLKVKSSKDSNKYMDIVKEKWEYGFL